MADLSISQIIQESLISESNGEEKGVWQRTKEALGDAHYSARLGQAYGRKGLKSRKSDNIHFKLANLVGRGEKTVGDAVNNHPKTAGAIAGAAGLAAGAYAYHRRKDIGKGLASLRDRVTGNTGIKGTLKRHGGKIAAGSLAAIGAGVGAKALINYLRKKKKQG